MTPARAVDEGELLAAIADCLAHCDEDLERGVIESEWRTELERLESTYYVWIAGVAVGERLVALPRNRERT